MPRRDPSPPPGLTYALLYTRVSGQEQEREGVSLPQQLAACRRYAADRGWVIAAEYVDVLSGTRDDRPGYQALLADVRARRQQGQAVVVVVMRLDRFGRKLLERVRARGELQGIGVATHSVADNGPVSDLTANILASVAEEEVRVLSARVSDARQHLARQGWWPGGRPPYGYCLRPATADERAQGAGRNVLDVDPAVAPFCAELLQRFLNGAPMHAVTRWLGTLPARARAGRIMAYPNVRDWLLSPTPRGLISATFGVAPATFQVARWPALIDPAQAAAIDARVRHWGTGARQPSGKYLLTGLLRCPACGGHLVGHAYRPPRRPRYDCNGQVPGRGLSGRCTYSAGVAVLDAAVLEAVDGLLIIAPRLERVWRRAWARLQQPVPIAHGQQQALERTRAQAQRRLRDAATLYVDGALDRAGYDAVRQDAEAALQAADAALAKLVENIPEIIPVPDWPAVRALVAAWPTLRAGADPLALRPVLLELVEAVTPHRVGWMRWRVDVRWSALGEMLARLGGTV